MADFFDELKEPGDSKEEGEEEEGDFSDEAPEEEEEWTPSLKLELAGATVVWVMQQGGSWHSSLRLEERDGRGICVVSRAESAPIQAGEVLVSVPVGLCISSSDAKADEAVRRVVGEDGTEAFGLLLLLLLKRLAVSEVDVAADPYVAFLQTCCDDDFLRPPVVGSGPLEEHLWKGVKAQDDAFDAAARPVLRRDAAFEAVDATAYACARKSRPRRGVRRVPRSAFRVGRSLPFPLGGTLGMTLSVVG